MQYMEARQRLYETYVTKHLGPIRAVSLESFESMRAVYRARYGAALPEDKQARILELGCGYGAFQYFLQREGYTNATGIDVSPEQVDLAKRLGLRNVAVAENLDFLRRHPGAFHAIAAIDVIEHYRKEELLELLQGIYDALVVGGVFMLQTPNADGPFGSRYRYFDFTHELAFTGSSVKQVLSSISFREVAVHPVEPTPHGFKSALRWALWKLIRQGMVFYLTVETGCSKDYILTQNLIAIARK